MTIGQHRGVHGAGRCTGNADGEEPGLLQQPIQHAPGEGAMGASTLESQIHGDGRAIAGRRDTLKRFSAWLLVIRDRCWHKLCDGLLCQAFRRAQFDQPVQPLWSPR